MKTEIELKGDIEKLIDQKQLIFNKLSIKKNRTVDKVEYYGKKLRTMQAKIDVLTSVING